MRLKDIEDCDDCPLFQKGYCKGGMTSDAYGNPVEPPCTSMDDDDEFEDVMTRIDAAEAYWEEVARREEIERRIKKEKAEKATYLRSLTGYERKRVSDLKKAIQARKSLVSTMSSLVKAFNTTNEMFKYEERVPEDFNSEDVYLMELEEKLVVAEKELKEARGKVQRSIGYRKAGLSKKPEYARDKQWYNLCKEGISCKTDELKDECLKELARNGIRREDGLILFFKRGDYYELYNGEKYYGYLDNNNKNDVLFKKFLRSVFNDLGVCEVVCFPGFTSEYFFSGYIACFSSVEDFLRAYSMNTGKIWGVVFSWLKDYETLCFFNGEDGSIEDIRNIYAHGYCHEWVKYTFSECDTAVVAVEYFEEDGSCKLIHCFRRSKDGKYIDVRGVFSSIDEVMEDYDYSFGYDILEYTTLDAYEKAVKNILGIDF